MIDKISFIYGLFAGFFVLLIVGCAAVVSTETGDFLAGSSNVVNIPGIGDVVVIGDKFITVAELEERLAALDTTIDSLEMNMDANINACKHECMATCEHDCVVRPQEHLDALRSEFEFLDALLER